MSSTRSRPWGVGTSTMKLTRGWWLMYAGCKSSNASSTVRITCSIAILCEGSEVRAGAMRRKKSYSISSSTVQNRAKGVTSNSCGAARPYLGPRTALECRSAWRLNIWISRNKSIARRAKVVKFQITYSNLQRRVTWQRQSAKLQFSPSLTQSLSQFRTVDSTTHRLTATKWMILYHHSSPCRSQLSQHHPTAKRRRQSLWSMMKLLTK